MSYEFMTDTVWERIEPLLPPRNTFGRPRCTDRDVLEGILWVFKTGARWRDLPDTLLETAEGLGGGRNMGCAVEGVHPDARRAADPGLGRVLHRRQLCSGEKRGLCVGKTKRGKGTKWMVLADGQGLPVGGTLESASPVEVKLAPEAIFIASERLGRWPNRLIADKAYDADWLRGVLEIVGGELICPHRRGRKRQPVQDGRKLRRYRKRWKIERLFAWLGNWRRLLIRHDRLLPVYSGFFKIACIMILIRYF